MPTAGEDSDLGAGICRLILVNHPCKQMCVRLILFVKYIIESDLTFRDFYN